LLSNEPELTRLQSHCCNPQLRLTKKFALTRGLRESPAIIGSAVLAIDSNAIKTLVPQGFLALGLILD
jgi:hypothetical protein